MRDKIIVVAGLAFGDEGKGSYTDFLTKEYDIKTLVRYAGGNQSNRTVTLPNGKQLEFSQLSSGMVNPDTHTYITKNVIVSLDNLIEEINDLAKITNENPIKILDRIHINKDCVCVTPYHKLINHLNEIIAGSERRGSVGLGASEARYLNDTFNISIKFSDLIYSKNKYRNFRDLYDFAARLFEEVNDKVMNKLPENIAYLIQEEAMNLLNEKTLNLIIRRETNIALALSKTIFDSDEEIVLTKDKVMFEGSLGLLIDKDYGLKPNTSLCDTSNSYPKKIISRDDAIYYGIIRSYYQRHGRGVFPTESRFLRKQLSSDKGDAGYWNGRVRYGWVDSVLYRYSIKVADVDEVLVSSLDALSNIKEIKICDYYFYNGLIDENDFFKWSVCFQGPEDPKYEGSFKLFLKLLYGSRTPSIAPIPKSDSLKPTAFAISAVSVFVHFICGSKLLVEWISLTKAKTSAQTELAVGISPAPGPVNITWLTGCAFITTEFVTLLICASGCSFETNIGWTLTSNLFPTSWAKAISLIL